MITAARVAALPLEQRQAFYASLTLDEALAIEQDWRFWARPEQLAPGTPGASNARTDWLIWLMLAGRGGGKTRGGAEWVIEECRADPRARFALIARTAGDVRTTMLEGPSGILTVAPPDFQPNYESTKCKMTFPNGAECLHFSADAPKGLRGPQFTRFWGDEIATWPSIRDEDDKPGVPSAWTQLEYGMRLPGARPRGVLTTTPKAIRIIKDLVGDSDCVVTKWSTFDNAANLAPEYIDRMRRKFEGTRVGRQELHAELLEDVEGALWAYRQWEREGARIIDAQLPELARKAVAVDPSGGHGSENDAQGIVVGGCTGGANPVGYVIKDLTCKLSPDGWGRRAVQGYLDHDCDLIVYEANFGGEMCEHVIQTAARALGLRSVPTKAVRATRGKYLRAEPVGALYEQGRCVHVGYFPELEDEMCQLVPGVLPSASPNRADALVFLMTELLLGSSPATYRSPSARSPRRV